MPALCLCFNIHEPYQFRRYTVFDMGQSSVYEDDDRNCETMPRRGMNFEQSATVLHEHLIRAATCAVDDLPQWRAEARALAEKSSWQFFFENYVRAFEIAFKKASTRINCDCGHDYSLAV